ncbi:hypothetical protein EDC04DRAFT_2605907 [Pisolithus marmoratus]|nr:hypothetical protein EDC04DRAFT_2605907 [Pisolithus marmoratus]
MHLKCKLKGKVAANSQFTAAEDAANTQITMNLNQGILLTLAKVVGGNFSNSAILGAFKLQNTLDCTYETQDDMEDSQTAPQSWSLQHHTPAVDNGLGAPPHNSCVCTPFTRNGEDEVCSARDGLIIDDVSLSEDDCFAESIVHGGAQGQSSFWASDYPNQQTSEAPCHMSHFDVGGQLSLTTDVIPSHPLPAATSTTSGRMSDVNSDLSQLQFYSPSVHDILEHAKQISHCDLAAVNSFPLHADFSCKASEYIIEAIAEHHSKGLLIPDEWWPHYMTGITKLLWEDLVKWHSSLKKKAHFFVHDHYEWDPQNHHDINAGIKGSFWNMVIQNNLAHPVLSGLIIRFFYTGTNAMANIFPEVFQLEVPHPAVALAVTAIKVTLDEVVAKGKEVTFKHDVYANIYTDILGLMAKCDMAPVLHAKTKACHMQWVKIGWNGSSAVMRQSDSEGSMNWNTLAQYWDSLGLCWGNLYRYSQLGLTCHPHSLQDISIPDWVDDILPEGDLSILNMQPRQPNESDYPLLVWLAQDHDNFLSELIHLEGQGSVSDICGGCGTLYPHFWTLPTSTSPFGSKTTVPVVYKLFTDDSCPHPGKNLPLDWRSVKPGKQFLYSLFVALNTNFRLKQRAVSKDLSDPSLSEGELILWRREKSMCSSHNAVNMADTKANKGLDATSVGIVVCARHGMKLANGARDLQKGERYANMDYLFTSALRGATIDKLNISYDITCQWHKSIYQRTMSLPQEVQLDLSGKHVSFFVPKFHLPAHVMPCQWKYSFNWMHGVGCTDGEVPECGCAHINPIGLSTKVMGPGHHCDTIDDFFGDWNWKKKTIMLDLQSFGKLVKQYCNEMNIKKALRSLRSPFLSTFIVVVTSEDWEDDPSKPNPLEVKEILPELTWRTSNTQKAKLQQYSNALAHCIEVWMKIHVLYVPSMATLQDQHYNEGCGKAGAPEDIPLHNLELIKFQLQEGQDNDMLNELHQGLWSRAYRLKFKDCFLHGQGTNTCACNCLKNVDAKIDLSVAKMIRQVRARARAHHWAEEVNLLLKEKQWSLQFLKWDAKHWAGRADAVTGQDELLDKGAMHQARSKFQ